MQDQTKKYWRTWYIAVIGLLVLQVMLYYCFTTYFK
jgi:hypothetical protein